MPAWAAKKPVLVYTTDRNGPQEIWIRGADGGDRPLVTARDFPPQTTQWYIAPALSPEADRVVYCLGGTHLWISSLSGGAPVRLTSDEASAEFPGSWSPDGSWFTYAAIRNGKKDLMKVKTSGQAAPVVVKSGISGEVPAWSPMGDWILAGLELISPDGVTVRKIADHGSANYGFSVDGKRLYGLRPDKERLLLFSVDVATDTEKLIGDAGKDFVPGSNLHRGFVSAWRLMERVSSTGQAM